jgi:hypothetical protein
VVLLASLCFPVNNFGDEFLNNAMEANNLGRGIGIAPVAVVGDVGEFAGLFQIKEFQLPLTQKDGTAVLVTTFTVLVS